MYREGSVASAHLHRGIAKASLIIVVGFCLVQMLREIGNIGIEA